MREGREVEATIMAQISAVLYLYINLCCIILGNVALEYDTKAPEVTARGHVIIGGMFSLHQGVDTYNSSFAPHSHKCVG